MSKVKIVAVGAGNRMNAYTRYALLHPEEMEIVAVADPNPLRRQHYRQLFTIPEERCFVSWKECLEGPRLGDAVFLCTPDHLHYEPAMQALEAGYDILLEKPVAQTWQQCRDMEEKSRQKSCIIGVCHVLRYHPYFRKLKEIIEGGRLGELISVSHTEAVGIERMTHAFVRGLWRKERDTNPMILSKACHDLDLLVWLTGRKCVEASSYGSLKWFRSENAPQGSTLRCIDGCAVEKECPYSALELYYRQKRWLRHFDIPEDADPDEVILNELKTGIYGRCVYRCDNDVVDHQTVSLLLEDQVTVSFAMEGFTKTGGRYTRLMFSKGEVYGDERILIVRHFLTGEPDEIYDFSAYWGECNFHGGADLNIVRDFLQAVKTREREALAVNIATSLESHRIAFEIEKSRKRNGR